MRGKNIFTLCFSTVWKKGDNKVNEGFCLG